MLQGATSSSRTSGSRFGLYGLVWCLAIGLALTAQAETDLGEFGLFPIDTRAEPGVPLAESDIFVVDTRSAQGVPSAESGTFTVDTLNGKGVAAAESRVFTVNTRIGGSSGIGESGFFTVDTRTTSLPSVILSGRVRGTNGLGLGGARVRALVTGREVGSGISAANGSYALPALPAGGYELRVSLAGHAEAVRVLVVNAAIGPQDFVLRAIPNAPVVVDSAQPVPESQQPRLTPISANQLKRYVSGAWRSNQSVDRNAMTVVMTHGMLSDPDEWAASMADEISRAVAAPVNILAWDWRQAADSLLPPVDKTPGQGEGLGRALWESLGPDYQGRIHFIGHSLGTLVNVTAANYLHGEGKTARVRAPIPWSAQNTHMTLFDEGEVATIAGQQTRNGFRLGFNAARGTHPAIQFSAGALGATIAAINDWRNPIPESSAWVDNYISLVGITHPNAVNVCLQRAGIYATDVLPDLKAYVERVHGYPAGWYRATVDDPSLSFMGFANSFERSEALPPANLRFAYGNLYIQTGSLAYEHQLREATDDDWTQCQQEIAKQIAATTVSEVTAAAVSTAQRVGNVAVETTEWVTDRVEDGIDRVQDGVTQTLDWFSRPGMRLSLTTGVGGLFGGGIMAAGAVPERTNSAASVWMTVPVPANAAMVMFDFMVSGDGNEDYVAFGLDGTNVFSLATRFVEPDVRTSSTLIDVSPYAGREVEFFFGVLGGSSTNCTVTVEGIRFLTLDQPALTATVNGTNAAVSWPLSATGFALESKVALNPQSSWETVTNTPAIVGSSFVVTNGVGGSRFFRLRRY